MVARTKVALGDTSLLLLKAFSEIISKANVSCFLSVSEMLSVESASEREHRWTLEMVLRQALELQYESVTSKRVGDIGERKRLEKATVKR